VRTPHPEPVDSNGSRRVIGGSAAAVAAGMPPLPRHRHGGSIRQPAACAASSAFKPTYGRVSRYGPHRPSLARSTRSARSPATSRLRLLLEVIAGHDRRTAQALTGRCPLYEDAKRPGQRSSHRRAARFFGQGLDSEWSRQ